MRSGIRPILPRSLTGALALLLALSACGDDWQPAFDERVDAARFESVEIADPKDALTFARTGNGARRLIAVTEYRDGVVRGVDLSAALGVDDPLPALERAGYDGLAKLVRDTPSAARVAVAARDLTIPIDLRERHVAAATNFPEHAGDAGVDDGPFLFAKLVTPTGPYADVPAAGALLDYEVEAAWVALAPLTPDVVQPENIGLILSNDFTDRDTLLRTLDPWNVESGDGFATGKSFPGYLPVGNLFVYPRDHRRFVADLELTLAVNGALRQRATGREMIWDIDQTVSETWARRDQRWQHRGAEIALLEDPSLIPPRTLILSGTPHGTVFDGLRPRHYAKGLGTWLLGGWHQPIPSHVVAAYIADARAAGAYLRPGDVVQIHVDRLGVMRNRIVP